MWDLKHDTDELIYETNRLTENTLVVAKGNGSGEWMEWEFGTSRCKLLYIKWFPVGTVFTIL